MSIMHLCILSIYISQLLIILPHQRLRFNPSTFIIVTFESQITFSISIFLPSVINSFGSCNWIFLTFANYWNIKKNMGIHELKLVKNVWEMVWIVS